MLTLFYFLAHSNPLKHTLSKNASKSPLAAQLAGVLGALNPAPEATPPADPEGEVSFQETEAPQEQLTEHQLLILKSIQQMEQVFDGEQLHIMNNVMVTLMKNPDQLVPVAELLNVQTEK
jgi:hypothetical protein